MGGNQSHLGRAEDSLRVERCRPGERSHLHRNPQKQAFLEQINAEVAAAKARAAAEKINKDKGDDNNTKLTDSVRTSDTRTDSVGS